MWILTTIGFFSIVQKDEDRGRGTLTIRARVRSDLEALRDGYLPSMGAITESSSSDYRYRATAPQAQVAEAVAKLTAAIDYGNFKDAVADEQGDDRADVYGRVWHELYQLQPKDETTTVTKSAPPVVITAMPTHGRHSRPRTDDDRS